MGLGENVPTTGVTPGRRCHRWVGLSDGVGRHVDMLICDCGCWSVAKGVCVCEVFVYLIGFLILQVVLVMNVGILTINAYEQ
jgi:hypothetical protein